MQDENLYQPPSSDLLSERNTELRYAGFWIRVAAALIDTLLMMMITFPLLMTIYGSEILQSGAMINGVWDFLISYIFPAVAVILFWIYKSATPGKMLCGLKVISLGKSEKLSVGQSIGRYLAYYPATLVLMLGLIWVAFDKRKQGWHDKLANTAVVIVN